MEKEVFVKLDSYNEALGLVDTMKTKLDKAKLTLEKVKKLKESEDTEIQLWQENLAAVEEKINFIDNTLVDPEL